MSISCHSPYRATDPWGGQSSPATVTLRLHTQSEADTELSVTPVSRLFGVETIGDCSGSLPVTFTVRSGGTGSRTLGTLRIENPGTGATSGEFAFASDLCSGATLQSGQSCTAAVKFCPQSVGSKAADLLIPSNDPETPVLTAFLYNYEAISDEASRRMPPVLYSLSIPEQMTAGQEYILNWSLLGYHESTFSHIAFFDCTGAAAGHCGDNYADNFMASGALSPVSVVAGDWTYSGVQSKRFNYSYTFTAPATRAGGAPWDGGGTDIVVRFYRKSLTDDEAGNRSLSLLIPGNLTPRYYDHEGRRILKKINPPSP